MPDFISVVLYFSAVSANDKPFTGGFHTGDGEIFTGILFLTEVDFS